MNDKRSDHQLPAELRNRINEIHRKLLHLHKTLLDSEREAYERMRGPVTSAQMLQLVIGDPFFDWLHGISRLIVTIDETLEAKDPPCNEQDIEALLVRINNLLNNPEPGSEFEQKYKDAMRREPAARLKHEELQKLLG